MVYSSLYGLIDSEDKSLGQKQIKEILTVHMSKEVKMYVLSVNKVHNFVRFSSSSGVGVQGSSPSPVPLVFLSPSPVSLSVSEISIT